MAIGPDPFCSENAMRIYIKYLKYVLRHKWFVFLECYKLGIPWLSIVHDWSKFLPSEFIPYARHFRGNIWRGRDGTGYYKASDTGDAAFDWAWFLHQKRNMHHWQWWIIPLDGGGIKVLPIPDKYRKEMVADWRGAGRAQGTPNTKTWYKEHRNDLVLHPETRAWIEKELML